MLILIYVGIHFNDIPQSYLLVAAAMIGGYMAMNIGANDVANAVGPLAAVYDTLVTGAIATKASIPLWVMVIGALGISIGLALFGPKLIKTVGSEITELDQTRAFCIAIAAAITVIVATQMGLPVSSTHTALGAVFGVGFLREGLKANYARVMDDIRDHHKDAPEGRLQEFLLEFEAADIHQKGNMLQALKANAKRLEMFITRIWSSGPWLPKSSRLGLSPFPFPLFLGPCFTLPFAGPCCRDHPQYA